MIYCHLVLLVHPKVILLLQTKNALLGATGTDVTSACSSGSPGADSIFSGEEDASLGSTGIDIGSSASPG